MIWIWQDF